MGNGTQTGTALGDDVEAIAAVIRAETEAFQRRDYAAWATCFVHDERLQDVYISPSTGFTVVSGWSAVSDHMKAAFESKATGPLVDFGQENLRVSVSGDVAWAVFDGWGVFGSGERDETFQTRILERQGGAWKIVYVSFAQMRGADVAGRRVSLDAEGRVVWAGEGSMAALASHPVLTVSGGRLRAHRREWDRALQAAIREAGGHHGFFQTYRVAMELGGVARYPVILGPTDEGGVAAVQMSIRDGMTYVEIDADGDLERRMRFARRVFGLSETQTRVAGRIAAGVGLKELAGEMGISVNTARTHLSRLYEKTGVNSQPALVRILLSVG